MKTKTVYVATAPVTFYDTRGNATVRPVGYEITEKEFKGLNGPRQAKFAPVTKNVGRVRFNGGTVTDLPVVDGVVKTTFTPDEFHLLPVEVHHLVNEVAELWVAQVPDVAFPGVCIGEYRGGDHHLTWWVAGSFFDVTVPPMLATCDKPCKFIKKHLKVGRYPYHTASLLKVAERLRGGRPVFASPEQSIDRILAA